MNVHFCGCVTHTVGTYSTENVLAVYETAIHVLPTSLFPTTTHLMACMAAYLIFIAMATMYGLPQSCVLQTQSVVEVENGRQMGK